MRRNRGKSRRILTRLVTVFLFLLIVAAVTGFAVLGVREFPPPTQTVEKTIPNERFPR